jgi:hypothetical protein
VFNEAGHELFSLSVAELAGLKGKDKRVLEYNAMSATDKALFDLISAILKEKKKHDNFLVYTGSSAKVSGLKFYKFDHVRRLHQEAIEFCEAKDLRLMTFGEAIDLQKELKADKTKLASWVRGFNGLHVWTASISVNSDTTNVPPYFFANADGYVWASANTDGRVNGGLNVCCVGQ